MPNDPSSKPESADRCTRPGEMGILLRREGIYSW
jgi:hypothetical protein